MSRLKRISSTAVGILYIVAAVLLCGSPQEGYLWVVTLIGFSLVAAGIKDVYYYVTMARFMVGGRYVLYRSIIMLQFGFFTWDLNDVPKFYVILYLAIIHAFAGLVGILYGRESMHYRSPGYKKEFIEGGVNLLIAILCLVFIKYIRTAVFIYSAGLVWNGIMMIRKSFEKQEMVYIK